MRPLTPNTQQHRENIKNRTMFYFYEQHPVRVALVRILDTSAYQFGIMAIILIGSIRFGLMGPFLDPSSERAKTLKILFILLTVLYSINILLGSIAFGFINFLNKNSPWNLLNFFITIVDIILCFSGSDNQFAQMISTCRILSFIQLGSYFSKDIQYAQIALWNALQRMISLTIFAFFMFIVYGVFCVKMLKGQFYYCTNLDPEIIEHHVKEKLDCMDYGGSWVNHIIAFDNIFDSILTLFIVSTSEGWMVIVEDAWNASGVDHQPHHNNNRWWAVYFQLCFFFGNIIVLNMFIGVIVNCYNSSRLQAQNLHLLDQNQREWYFIKESIFEMKPICKVEIVSISQSVRPKNFIRSCCFTLVKHPKLKVFWLLIIFANTITLSLYTHRQSSGFRTALDTLNIIFIGIFIFEILIRLIAKDPRIFISDFSNILDITCIWICLANLFTRNDTSIDFYFCRCFNAVSVAIQMARNYRIIKRFNSLQKLFSSITAVLPSALAMILIMFCVLFVYTCLGMNMFGYIRPDRHINYFDVHFRKFSTAMFALIRVASIEQWFYLLSETARLRQPNFACVDIDSYDDYVAEGLIGCGTHYSYVYFVSFHLVFSLVIMNLFIASLIETFFENAKSEKSAVSKYQLNDILKLWVLFDPQGQGFITYKDFWSLTSKFAMIIGVDQKHMLEDKTKKHFLTVLNIPIYESVSSNLFCLKFHDVLINLTLITVSLKYGVTNLEPQDKDLRHKLHHQLIHMEHSHKEKQLRETPFNSSDMMTIIYIQRKIRELKQRKRTRSKVFVDISDVSRVH